MISRWLCAVYNLARVKSIKRNVEHTVYGYIRIIKLNITIAKDRSYSKLLSEKFSPPNFPERWITTKKEINLDIDFCSNSIDRLQRTETNEERIFRVKGERCSYQLPSLPWSKRRKRGGGGEGASCPAKVAKRGLSPTYTISGPHTHRALYFASRYCPGGSESVLKFPQRRTLGSRYVSRANKKAIRANAIRYYGTLSGIG